MTDQCHRCTMRGDFAGCKATPCNIHESWHVEQLNATISRLEAELAEARKPDCHSCNWFNARDVSCVLEGGEAECVNGDSYEYAVPLRLYEKEGK